ncbi:hypothetical protein B0H14DRAFT_2626044 [Mycena olivaceomarginata]|nr:hypothetical protein B0H14DRAFT_2626044 [Mycena olivaceomarginata]
MSPGLPLRQPLLTRNHREAPVAHDTVDKPDCESRGMASSGIGTVDCACHNMKRANGVGDLQQGEKYLNMDYLYFMSLLGTLLLHFFVSYDIACQWYKNLWGHMTIFPAEAQLGRVKKFVFLVPKFHLPMHIEECNINFSFNLTPFYSNWKKITKLGTVLLDNIEKCVPMMLETHAAWVDVEASFEPSVIETWTAMAVTWEADGKHPTPSRQRRSTTALRRRDLVTHMKQISAHEMVHQETKCLEHETKLQRKIDSWMAIQQLLIPEVTVLQDREDAKRKCVGVTQPVPGLRAQDMSLWLPFAIGTCAQCPVRLQEYEFQLRQGQAVWVLKYIYRGGVHGTKAKLRSGSRTDTIQLRIDSSVAEYCTACAALVKLGAILKRTEWQQHLWLLLAEDVWGRPHTTFGDPEQQRRGGKKKKRAQLPVMGLEDALAAEIQAEVKKEMSWIWYSEGKTGKPEEVVRSEPLRIEWARMRAKAMHYAEEIDLVEEEMWRVLQFLSGGEIERQAAYARKQAGYMHGLQEHFKQLWRYVLQELRMARNGYATMTTDDDETADGVQEPQLSLATSAAAEAATRPQTELERELVHE